MTEYSKVKLAYLDAPGVVRLSHSSIIEAHRKKERASLGLPGLFDRARLVTDTARLSVVVTTRKDS